MFICNRKLYIGAFYRPPSSDIKFSYFESLVTAVARSINFSDFILMGDFNIDYANQIPYHLYSRSVEL